MEKRKPWIYCYGCGAHTINLLAGDCRKIPMISDVLENNRKIVNFFRLHTMAKEILKEITKSLFGKELNVVLGCVTRWSTDYFMILRNLRLKIALVNAAIDSQLAREFKDQKNSEVKNLIVSDEHFWGTSQSVCDLMKPMMTGIEYCEGDDVTLSVMPRIWQHITWKLNTSSLEKLGFPQEVVAAVIEAVKKRSAMNTRPITVACHALDPRMCGEHLSEEQWNDACNVIMKMAESENCDRAKVLGDLAEYRAKTGTVFGNDVVWEAAIVDPCSNSPQLWWSSFASSREIAKVAVILMNMPATAAIIERCNKAYAVTKTKSRNRLTPKRGAKLAMVSYNMKIQSKMSQQSNRAVKRRKRNHILSLTVGPGPDIQSTMPSTRDQDVIPACESEFESENDTEIENTGSSSEDEDTQDSQTQEMHTDSESDIEEDTTELLSVSLISGDWVACRVCEEIKQTKGKQTMKDKQTTKGKQRFEYC